MTTILSAVAAEVPQNFGIETFEVVDTVFGKCHKFEIEADEWNQVRSFVERNYGTAFVTRSSEVINSVVLKV